jgi:hypothetical protein
LWERAGNALSELVIFNIFSGGKQEGAWGKYITLHPMSTLYYIWSFAFMIIIMQRFEL